MPDELSLSQTIHDDLQLLHVGWSGHVTLGSIARGYEAFSGRPEAGRVTRGLHDLRGIENLSLFQSGVDSLGEMIRTDAAN